MDVEYFFNIPSECNNVSHSSVKKLMFPVHIGHSWTGTVSCSRADLLQRQQWCHSSLWHHRWGFLPEGPVFLCWFQDFTYVTCNFYQEKVELCSIN